MAKPTFVFVHGAWHSGNGWEPVSRILRPLGYGCVAVDLPATIRDGGSPVGVEKDAEVVRQAIFQQLDQGNNVVVVCHSWGGLPSVSSLEGLDPASRQTEGYESSVIGLAGISTFLPQAGQTIPDIHANGKVEPAIAVPEGAVAIVMTDPGPAHWFYHDLPTEEAEKWVASLHPHSMASFGVAAQFTPFGKIPTHYLYCRQDKAILYPTQKYIVQQLKDAGFQVRTEEVDASHSPFLSQVERTAEYLRRSAGEQIPG